MPELTGFLSVAWLALQAGTLLFLLGSAAYQMHLMRVYRKHRGPDAKPARCFAEDELPHVTIQLPVYNEGRSSNAACARPPRWTTRKTASRCRSSTTRTTARRASSSIE